MPLPITRGAASAQGFGFLQGSSWWPVGVAFEFNNAETQGATGPDLGTLLAAYAGQKFVTLGYFTATSGIQTVSNIPIGTYRITLNGAEGNDPLDNRGNGGYGARVQCDFVFSTITTISMIVAQRGRKVNGGNPDSQVGGGASSFWVGAYNDPYYATQYGIAGGGGGAINGGAGSYATGNVTGANSDGQNTGNAGASTDYSGGGAGYFGGASGPSAKAPYAAANSVINGGNGMICQGGEAGGNGGFGGGGGQTNSGNNRAGGGGGYTGGVGKNPDAGATGSGGGGSKFVGGVNSGSYLTGNDGTGFITILRLA